MATNRNIVMKQRLNDEWQNIFPFTLTTNVLNKDGSPISATMAHKKDIQHVNILDYEKDVADGDWAIAFQKAVDELPSGGVLYVPAGIYEMKTIVILKSFVEIRMNKYATLKRTGSQYCFFTNGKPSDVFAGYDGNTDITIIGGTLDVNGFDHPVNGGGITFGHSRNIIIKNVTFKNIYNIHAIEINSTENAEVKDCIFDGFNYSGDRSYAEFIQIDLMKNENVFPLFGAFDKTPCKHISIHNNTFRNGGGGVGTHVTEAQVYHDSVHIYENTFENLLDIAVHCRNFSRGKVSHNRIANVGTGIKIEGSYEMLVDGNDITVTNDRGFEIFNSGKSIASNNKISWCGAEGISMYRNPQEWVFTNHQVFFCASHGIVMDNVIDSQFNNMIVHDNDGHGVMLINKTNNVDFQGKVNTNKGHGLLINNCNYNKIRGLFLVNNQSQSDNSNIAIVNDSNNNTVMNVRCRGDKTKYGLIMGLGSDHNMIYFCDLRGSGTTANIYDESTTSVQSNNIVG